MYTFAFSIFLITSILFLIVSPIVWSITNNMSKTKKRQEKIALKNMAIQLAVYGDYELAQKMIENSLDEDVKNLSIKNLSDKKYYSQLSYLLRDYKFICDILNLNMPETEKYKDQNSFLQSMRSK